MTEVYEHEAAVPDELRHLYDIDLEKTVLGCVLMSPEDADAALADAADRLCAADFYRPAHATVWNAVQAMADRRTPLEATALVAELREQGELERCGGPTYIAGLIGKGITPANAGYYARKVAEMARKRRYFESGTRFLQMVTSGQGEADELAEAAEELLGGLHSRGPGADAVEEVEQMLPDVIDDLASDEDPMGVPSGFADLDTKLNGFQPGELIVVGARPGVGKTVFGVNVATAAARAGHRTLFVSLEMNRKEIGHRLLSAEARVPLHSIRSKKLSEDDWARLAKARPDLSALPLAISHDPAITFNQIRAEIRRQARRGLGMVVIDYLQLIQDPDSKSADTREREVALMTRGLKVLAQQVGVPIMVLAQLNRESMRREDTRPRSHELRESGSVEQDANTIILIHREDAHDQNSPRSGEADLIVDKNRNGPKGDVTVAFQGHYASFVDMAPEPAAGV
ncbi:replicative DNA helicase [Nocardiopsis halophila]|uniref:replicative DNA helicase n=1 Tax=Nocardiopsis halophila TaxID=141692 RepID=UPI00034CE5AD|nr:replicative DNA helicase [Nocardiopsis halophila]